MSKSLPETQTDPTSSHVLVCPVRIKAALPGGSWTSSAASASGFCRESVRAQRACVSGLPARSTAARRVVFGCVSVHLTLREVTALGADSFVSRLSFRQQRLRPRDRVLPIVLRACRLSVRSCRPLDGQVSRCNSVPRLCLLLGTAARLLVLLE